MRITDLTKDVRRYLLQHWTEKEINERLEDPEYFFEHVVKTQMDHLRLMGEEVPRFRLKKSPTGEMIVLINK